MSAEAGSRCRRLLPFEADHLALIKGTEPVLANLAAWGALTPGGAVTLMGDAGVLGCAGLVATGDGCAEAWAVVSPALRARPMVLHRLALRGLEIAPFQRIGATVQREYAAGEQWLCRLGFRRTTQNPGLSAMSWTGDYVRYERCRN